MGELVIHRGGKAHYRRVIHREMPMGVFLCESRHGIHVSSCVIMIEGGPVGAEAYQKLMCCLQCVGVRCTLERIAFTRHRMQLFLDPRVYIAVRYLMTPNYECTPTRRLRFEIRIIYGG